MLENELFTTNCGQRVKPEKIAVPILCFTLYCMPLTSFCIPVVSHTWTHLLPQYFIAPILYRTHTHTQPSCVTL